MRRCVIIGGADINNTEFVKSHLAPGDYVIACDRGLVNCDLLGISPDLIVGDFDSHAEPVTQTEKIVLPCEKDDTDTFFAVKEAIRRGFEDFLLLGVFGNRLDHTFGNISILFMLDEQKMSALAVDDFSEISIISSQTAIVSDKAKYYSIIAIGGSASGVTETGCKYPLDNATIVPGYQYAVSNEVLPGETAQISVTNGKLLLIITY